MKLPNGIQISRSNTITLTNDDDTAWMGDYEKYLKRSITSITVKARSGNDTMSPGALIHRIYNGVSTYPDNTVLEISLYGEEGDDTFFIKTGGIVEAFGGKGFDEVRADMGTDFITNFYNFEVLGDELHFSPKPKTPEKLGLGRGGHNTRLIVDKDVELIGDFGGNYLKVDDLFKGKVKYLTRKEADLYKGAYEAYPDRDTEVTPKGNIIVKNVTNNIVNNTTNNTTTTNITNTGSGNINVGNIGTVNNTTTINNSFTVQTTNINLSLAITGDSNKSEKVEGTDDDDLIADGSGKDKLIGNDGADRFYFSGEEPYNKKFADQILDFDASEGDAILIDEDVVSNPSITNKVIDNLADTTAAAIPIAENNKQLQQLSDDGHQFIYNERQGELLLDNNGKDKGFGDKDTDSLIANLGKKTELTDALIDDVLDDLEADPSLAIAESKKELKSLAKDDYDLIYFEPKGDLYVDGNGSNKGFGKQTDGGLIADLPNNSTLSEDNLLIAD